MSEWIATTDRMPDVGVEVLGVCFNNGCWLSSVWRVEGFAPFDFADADERHVWVSHWMPLPALPETKSPAESDGAEEESE